MNAKIPRPTVSKEMNRKEFLKFSGLTALGLVGAGKIVSILVDDKSGNPVATADINSAVQSCANAEAKIAKAEAIRIESENARQRGETIRNAESAKWQNASAEVKTLSPGSPATLNITDSDAGKVFTLGVPKGEAGAVGPNNLYIQDNAPTVTEPSVWIQTGANKSIWLVTP